MTLRARWLAVAMLTGFLAACDSAEDRAAGHFEAAMELLAEGQPARANVEFRNVLQLQPENVEARFQVAEFLRSRNNLRGALGQYRRVVELETDHVPARKALAEIMLIANQLEEASRHIEAAFEVRAEDVSIRAVKAAVDYRLARSVDEDPADAVALAREVIAADPAATSARLVLAAFAMDEQDLTEALAQVDAGLEQAPEDLSLNVVRLGVLEQREDLEGVGAQLKRLVELFPGNEQFRESLARWHAFKGEHDAAEAQYRALAERNPDDEQRALDVVRFLNAVHGEGRAREELLTLARRPGASVDYALAIVAMDLRDGDQAAAAARLDRMVENRGLTEGGFKARVERAKLHLRNDEAEAADALIAEVLSNDPENADALLLRASRFLAADRPDPAIEDLRNALDVAPENVQAVLLLATAYERNGNAALAQERLAEAVQLSEFDVGVTLRYAQTLLADGKNAVAESVLRQALAERGMNRDLLVAFGQIKLRQQAWREAAGVAEQLRTLDPDDPVAARLEAAALLGQQRGDEGTQMLEDLVQADPSDSSAVIAFVRALIAGGDLERARTFLQDELGETPDDTTALLLLSSINASMGELDEAEALLKRTIEADPGNAQAYAALARIYNSQGRSELVTATLRQGLETSADPSLRLTKAMQLDYEGDHDAALAMYDELYREQPNSIVVANNFASLLADHRADDPASVERAYNIAKRFRSSDQPHMLDTYGWLLHLTGDSRSALPRLEQAAEALPTNPLVQYHFGVVLAANGQTAQARARLQRALELGDQVPFAHADKATAELARLETSDAPTTTE